MIRIVDLVCLLAIVAGAVWTYQVKRHAEGSQREIVRLTRAIAVEKERAMFLRADWAYLTSPARLERLAARFGEQLGLRPTVATQIVGLADLPAREEREGSVIAEDDAPLTTGSVSPAVPGSIDDILMQDAARRSR